MSARKNKRGFIDPFSLIAIGFLVTTLVIGLSVTNNPVKKFLINSLAIRTNDAGGGGTGSIILNNPVDTSTSGAGGSSVNEGSESKYDLKLEKLANQITVPTTTTVNTTVPPPTTETADTTTDTSSGTGGTDTSTGDTSTTELGGYTLEEATNVNAEEGRTGDLGEDGIPHGFYLAPNGRYYLIEGVNRTAEDTAYINYNKADDTTKAILNEMAKYVGSEGSLTVNQVIQIGAICEATPGADCSDLKKFASDYIAYYGVSPIQPITTTPETQEPLTLQNITGTSPGTNIYTGQYTVPDNLFTQLNNQATSPLQYTNQDARGTQPTQQQLDQASSFDQTKIDITNQVDYSILNQAQNQAAIDRNQEETQIADSKLADSGSVQQQYAGTRIQQIQQAQMESINQLANGSGNLSFYEQISQPVYSNLADNTLKGGSQEQIFVDQAKVGNPNAVGGLFSGILEKIVPLPTEVKNFATCNQPGLSVVQIQSCNEGLSRFSETPIVGNYVTTYSETATNYSNENYVQQAFTHPENYAASIRLGTTITAVGATIPAAAEVIASGSIGAGLAAGFRGLAAITTLNQSGRAAAAQVEDPFSKQANMETLYAALSWTNLGTADFLINSFNTGSNIVAAKWLNGIVSGVNLGVDSGQVKTGCFGENASTFNCIMSSGAVVADIGFGALDFYQGQLPGSKASAIELANAKLAPGETELVEVRLNKQTGVYEPDVTYLADTSQSNRIILDQNGVPIENTQVAGLLPNEAIPVAAGDVFYKQPEIIDAAFVGSSEELAYVNDVTAEITGNRVSNNQVAVNDVGNIGRGGGLLVRDGVNYSLNTIDPGATGGFFDVTATQALSKNTPPLTIADFITDPIGSAQKFLVDRIVINNAEEVGAPTKSYDAPQGQNPETVNTTPTLLNRIADLVLGKNKPGVDVISYKTDPTTGEVVVKSLTYNITDDGSRIAIFTPETGKVEIIQVTEFVNGQNNLVNKPLGTIDVTTTDSPYGRLVQETNGKYSLVLEGSKTITIDPEAALPTKPIIERLTDGISSLFGNKPEQPQVQNINQLVEPGITKINPPSQGLSGETGAGSFLITPDSPIAKVVDTVTNVGKKVLGIGENAPTPDQVQRLESDIASVKEGYARVSQEIASNGGPDTSRVMGVVSAGGDANNLLPTTLNQMLDQLTETGKRGDIIVGFNNGFDGTPTISDIQSTRSDVEVVVVKADLKTSPTEPATIRDLSGNQYYITSPTDTNEHRIIFIEQPESPNAQGKIRMLGDINGLVESSIETGWNPPEITLAFDSESRFLTRIPGEIPDPTSNGLKTLITTLEQNPDLSALGTRNYFVNYENGIPNYSVEVGPMQKFMELVHSEGGYYYLPGGGTAFKTDVYQPALKRLIDTQPGQRNEDTILTVLLEEAGFKTAMEQNSLSTNNTPPATNRQAALDQMTRWTSAMIGMENIYGPQKARSYLYTTLGNNIVTGTRVYFETAKSVYGSRFWPNIGSILGEYFDILSSAPDYFKMRSAAVANPDRPLDPNFDSSWITPGQSKEAQQYAAHVTESPPIKINKDGTLGARVLNDSNSIEIVQIRPDGETILLDTITPSDESSTYGRLIETPKKELVFIRTELDGSTNVIPLTQNNPTIIERLTSPISNRIAVANTTDQIKKMPGVPNSTQITEVLLENGYSTKNINPEVVGKIEDEVKYIDDSVQRLIRSLPEDFRGGPKVVDVSQDFPEATKITPSFITSAVVLSAPILRILYTAAVHDDDTKSYVQELIHEGYYSPTLGTWVVYNRETEKWYRTDTGEELPKIDSISYMETPVLSSGGYSYFVLGQYDVINDETFKSPEWQTIENNIKYLTRNDPYNLDLINGAIHDSLTYSSHFFDSLAVRSSSNVSYYRYLFDVTGLSGVYLGERNLKDVISDELVICLEYAATEQAYLAKLGISSEYAIATTQFGSEEPAGHAFLIVTDKNNQKWVLDPTNNIVSPLEDYSKEHNVADLKTTDSIYSFINPQNAPEFNVGQGVSLSQKIQNTYNGFVSDAYRYWRQGEFLFQNQAQ